MLFYVYVIFERKTSLIEITNFYAEGVHETGRIRASISGGFGKWNYEDGQLVGGLPADQDFRDRDIIDAGARVDYAISPDTAVFAQPRSGCGVVGPIPDAVSEYESNRGCLHLLVLRNRANDE